MTALGSAKGSCFLYQVESYYDIHVIRTREKERTLRLGAALYSFPHRRALQLRSMLLLCREKNVAFVGLKAGIPR